MVPTADPKAAIRGGKHGVDFGGCQIADEAPIAAFLRDGEDALDERGMGRLLHGDVSKEGADRRQACVAGPRAITPGGFELAKEGPDEIGVHIVQLERGWLLLQALLCEVQQESKGVAIGGDGVRACPPLGLQTVSKEGFEQGGKSHDCSCHARSRRFAASISSSGVAVRYQ